MSWHLHKWTKWIDFNEPFTLQYKRCLTCGKREERIP